MSKRMDTLADYPNMTTHPDTDYPGLRPIPPDVDTTSGRYDLFEAVATVGILLLIGYALAYLASH